MNLCQRSSLTYRRKCFLFISQGQYIFEKGQKILQTLSDYMGIDYYSKMPKMDLVAVPDFDAGAMENWGMNTYR